jgi:phage terminase large subunit-like protein
LLEEMERRKARRKLKDLYPDEGPLRRELYRKHMEFFRLGSDPGINERAFMAANRIGKTWGAGGYETALHLTGQYPDWWEGRRFDHPVDWWAAGDTGETTRDIIQFCLMGPIDELGTGLIPGAAIVGEPSHRRGVADALDTVGVQHVSGGISSLGFKSYDQGRKKFQGTEKHGAWLDEEPPQEVYTECLLRLMTTEGLMMLTFTPLSGVSEVVLQFMSEEALASLGNSDVG